jgi:hypothetical protein
MDYSQIKDPQLVGLLKWKLERDRYFCSSCGKELTKRQTFLEPFTCDPTRYTKCCRNGKFSFTPVCTVGPDGKVVMT